MQKLISFVTIALGLAVSAHASLTAPTQVASGATYSIQAIYDSPDPGAGTYLYKDGNYVAGANGQSPLFYSTCDFGNKVVHYRLETLSLYYEYNPENDDWMEYCSYSEGYFDVIIGLGDDNTPPSAPTNLHEVSKTATSVVLAWSPSSDANGISRYEIKYAGYPNKLCGTGTSVTITGLTQGTTYQFYAVAYDPSNNCSVNSNVCTVQTPLLDSDGDGMPDIWETAHGLNPSANDANLDPDGDGLTNLQEYQNGTDPNKTDITSLPTGVQLIIRIPSNQYRGINTSTWKITPATNP